MVIEEERITQNNECTKDAIVWRARRGRWVDGKHSLSKGAGITLDLGQE